MSSFRHEYKYLVDRFLESLVLTRVRAALRPDPHAGVQGAYTVRSLYFDDPDDGCLYENEDGVDRRSKFRVRYYNGYQGQMRLERKAKLHGMTQKRGCELSEEEFRLLCQGKGIQIRGDAVKTELVTELYLRGMAPRTIVTYDRIPFVYSGGNVRITFDRRITSSSATDSFLAGNYRQFPVMGGGMSVLEVKFDEYLPPYIKDIVQSDGLSWTSFSKYRICRLNEVSG